MGLKITFLVLLILLSPLCSQCLNSYVTNPNRTKTVQGLCTSFPDRTKIVSSTDTQEIDQYNQIMKASFSVTGNQLLKTFLEKKDAQAILDSYPNLPMEYGLFAGIFMVGMIFLIISCLCSCCCCCCPDCCPPSSCCRHEKDKPYNKCQLVWPAIVLLLALGLILAAGAIGLSKSKDIQTTIEAVGCSVSITLDDIINGNVTESGRFFVGIRTLSNKIAQIKASLTSIDTQLTSIIPSGSTYTATTTAYTNAKGAISLVPSNTNSTGANPFSYQTPFDGAGATAATLASNLPTDLGSNNPADAGTPIYNAYYGLDLIQTGLSDMSNGAQSLKTTISSGFSTALDAAKQPLQDVAKLLQSGDATYFEIYSQVSPNFPTINTAVTGIYAGLVGLSSLAMLATLLMVICNLYKCRFLLYFVCILLVFVGLISFLLATLVSALIPMMYFGCDILTFSISSAANFNSNFGSFISGDMASTASMITVCLKGQSGDFLQSTGLGSVTSSLTDLRTMINAVNSFDAAAINVQVDNAWLPAFNLINDYYSGKRLDFTSPSDQAILERISNKNNYGCTSPLFATDSWVPTINSGTISCKVTTSSADNVLCTSANLRAGTGGCAGCLDAHKILNVFSGAISAQIDVRYPDPTCATFNDQLQYSYENYYSYKQTNYGPINTRAGTADAAVTTYKTEISDFGIAVTAVKNNLLGTVASVVDPQYGIIAGLNCAIIGQDLFLIVNTVCSHGFKLSFFIRLAFGIAGFGVLFTACCASCTGVRHYKQSMVQSKARLEVKDITNETMQDIMPVEMNKMKSKQNSNSKALNRPPPNQKYY